MTFWMGLLMVVTYAFQALSDWLYIFISPIKNLSSLWILGPIWVSWFFAEFFQEKKGTSFGNAISNGVVPLFVGLDWTRYLTNQLIKNESGFSWHIFALYFICTIVMIYGFLIIYFGIKGKKWIRYFGRIREVTYVFVMLSPVIYNILPLTWRFVLLTIIFFPIYYYLIEFIAMFTPDPESFRKDVEGEQTSKKKFNELNSNDNFETNLDDNFNSPTNFNNNINSNNYKHNSNNNFKM
ncbi:MAG: hypothetical protein AB7V77_04620 [Candidatus Woesearchaeota archaeon]